MMDANRASNNEESPDDTGMMGDISHAADDGASKSVGSNSQAHGALTGQRGGATSALTRDAARLRSVMIQATERGESHQAQDEGDRKDQPFAVADDEQALSDARNRGDLARTAAMPSLPDLADEQVSPPPLRESRTETPVMRDSVAVPAGSRRPTSLRIPTSGNSMAAAQRASRPSHATGERATNGATTLKPVDALRSAFQVSNRTSPPVAGGALQSGAPAAAPEMRERSMNAPTMIAAAPDRAMPEAQEAPPAYTEIERKEHYSYGADERPSTQGERIGVDAPSHHIGVEESRPYVRPARRKGPGIGRAILMGATVLVGTTIGIGLYAGGGDLLSELFSNNNEGVAVQSPSAVTERPAVPPPPVESGPATTSGEEGGSVPNAALLTDSLPRTATSAPPTSAESDARPIDGAQRTNSRVEPSRTEPTVIDAEKRSRGVQTERVARRDTAAASRTASAAKPSGAAKPVAALEGKRKADEKKGADKTKTPESKVNRYLVQVRATPDEAEAKLIAKRLRSKGASNVAIVPSKAKDGSTLYRVRYNTTGTVSEAQAAATRAGYGKVWVVKQNQ